MRDHAVAYASAAAGAAWAAAQIAAQAAEFAAGTSAHIGPAFVEAGGAGSSAGGAMPPVPPGMYYPAIGPDGQMFNNSNSYVFQGNQETYWEDYHQEDFQQEKEEDEGEECPAYPQRNTRRKRFQRRPPGGISIPRPSYHQYSNNSNNINSNNNDGSRVRRRLRDRGDSSNSSCCSGSLGTSVTSYNSDQANSNMNNNRRSYHKHCNNNNSSGHYHRRNSNRNSGSSSGGADAGLVVDAGNSRGNHYHRYKKKQRQPPDDTSLLGKLAVSALYEFCDKRRMAQPSFKLLVPSPNVDKQTGEIVLPASRESPGDFEMAVCLEDGVEWGRGRGRIKKAAKEDAARKALLALVPGLVFDPETGIIIELPPAMPSAASPYPTSASLVGERKHRGTSASMEDLAPHLASRLAIASGDNETSKTLKRAWNRYPGHTSTTTSEEDDENAYYASRGASVCSALLHAMVQIDDQILGAPEYSFDVSKIPTTSAQMKRKGPASSGGSAIVIHRGSFTCTATLKVRPRKETKSRTKNHGVGECCEVESTSERKGQLKDDPEEEEDKKTKANASDKTNEKEAWSDAANQITILKASGVGGTKREAKHTASARLLAQLFPDCEDMVQVKAAAEAAREQYAASKVGANSSNRRRQGKRNDRSKMPRLAPSSGLSRLSELCTPAADDPALPFSLTNELRALLGQKKDSSNASVMHRQVASFQKLNINQDGADEQRSASVSLSSDGRQQRPQTQSTARNGIDRHVSRRMQLEEQVDRALQTLNEHDDEGRSLPDELTADDVGRTVLRRAELEDTERIQRLLPCENVGGRPSCKAPVSVLGAVVPTTDDSTSEADRKGRKRSSSEDASIASRLWGSSSFVLLLCRAIAVYEDPPLGCAVLTLGFSMEMGKTLRISQLGSEPHLPCERFLECLEAFATSMNCRLERNHGALPSSRGDISGFGIYLKDSDLKAVVDSHVICVPKLTNVPQNTVRTVERGHASGISAPLQSVQEESENGEESDGSVEVNSGGKVKGQDKPSKRSRVE